MRLVDTHAHLHFGRCLGDLEAIVDRFLKSGGEFLVNIGVNVEDSKRAVEFAKRFGFKAAVGIHPHDSKGVPEDYIELLKELAEGETVVAIGEIGLDYYRDLSPRSVQRRVFIEQIELAREIGKPLIVHVRDAYDDVYSILKSSDLPDLPGVIHAFSADLRWAEKFVDLGFFIGIGGPVTYPKNEELREVVREIPLDKILTETDCPYLPPQPFRGRRNEPVYVEHVVLEISKQLGVDPSDVADVVLENAKRLFEGARE